MLAAKNVREWFAFYGGEELGISLEHASVVWDAAVKSMEAVATSHNKPQGITHTSTRNPCPTCKSKDTDELRMAHICNRCKFIWE
jgi:hypothetical protein